MTRSRGLSTACALALLSCTGATFSLGENDVPGGTDGGGGSGSGGAVDASSSGSGSGGVRDSSSTDGSGEVAADSPAAADTSDGPFNPGSLRGLVLWLDAARGVTVAAGSVSSWADQSGAHNDATQSMASIQPTFRASSEIAGLPAVHFADSPTLGNELDIADSPTLQWGTGDFYLVVVSRFDNMIDGGPEPAVANLYSKLSLTMGGGFAGPMLTGNIPSSFDSNQTGLACATGGSPGDFAETHTPYNDGVPRAYAMQRIGTGLDLRVNGASVATGASSGVDVSSPGVSVNIGANAMGQGSRLGGDIAEMIAVAGTLDPSDRARLESWLVAKYGL